MRTVFKHLMIGSTNEAYNVLNTGLYTDVKAVLDLTKDLPTRKWLRKGVDVKLKKVTNLMKALDFIHEERKACNNVLVVGENAVLYCAIYLMLRKDLSIEEAFEQCGGTADDAAKILAGKVKAPVV